MNECASGAGSRGEVTVIDSEAVLSELSRGNFATSTNAGTYSPELLTTSYIGGLFKALSDVENYWNECVSHTRSYIENFENIPLPESFDDDSAFLDETEYASAVGASLTGVTSSLNIRSSASTNSSKIGNISAGSEIKEVTGEVIDKDGKKWYKIKTEDGKEGYVSGDYVSLNEDPSKIENAGGTKQSVQTENTDNSSQTTQVESSEVEEMPVVHDEPLDNKAASTTGTTNTANSEEKVNGKDMPVAHDEKLSNNVGVVKLDNDNSHLNIRSTPDSNNSGNIVGQFSQGDKVTILGEENGFLKIKTSTGETAYVSKDYVSVPENSKIPQNIAVDIPRKATVKLNDSTSNLNFRSNPNKTTNKNIIGSIGNNSQVEVIERSGDWTKINYNGKEGWVYSEYLDS